VPKKGVGTMTFSTIHTTECHITVASAVMLSVTVLNVVATNGEVDATHST
jgi:hypothetical protein